MYTLVVLLSVLATAAFLHAFVFGRRRYLPLFAGLLALMLYTHNWSVFFAVAAALALLLCTRDSLDRRRQLTDGLLAFGAAAVAFAPWVPTLVFQALHTGAPWSRPPSPFGLLGGPAALLSGDGAAMALLLAGGSGAAVILRERHAERTAVLATLVFASATLLSAWLFSQVSPAWANRYLAVLLGPLLLLAAAGLARAGRLGLVALALVLLFWASYAPSDDKSNVKDAASELAWRLEPGDLVISTQPEQVAVLHYYLPPGLPYVTPLGPVANPRVMDWRGAVERLRAATARKSLPPLLASVPPGGRLVLVRPVVDPGEGWRATWTRLVRIRSRQWARFLARDERFVRIATAPHPVRNTFKGVRAIVYTKTGSGASATEP